MDAKTREKIHELLDAVIDRKDTDFGFHSCVCGVTVDIRSESDSKPYVHYIGRNYGDPIERILEDVRK